MFIYILVYISVKIVMDIYTCIYSMSEVVIGDLICIMLVLLRVFVVAWYIEHRLCSSGAVSYI